MRAQAVLNAIKCFITFTLLYKQIQKELGERGGMVVARLFLYTKLGPVSGTQFFPSWQRKFPID